MNTILRPLPVCLWIASFGSIALLIGQVSGVGTMHALLLPVALPCVAVIAAGWLKASSKGDHFLTERLRLGLVGGLWGTVGYDAVRVPLHLMGLNPFRPSAPMACGCAVSIMPRR
jgi:apolipoprotein N-acyltransferase